MNAGSCYHIYNRGINKQPIFFQEDNYVYFLQLFKKYLGAHVKVLAYCLMPNHFHFFLRIEHQEALCSQVTNLNVVEKAFKDFFISYAKAVNKRYDRTGGLFQYKFKRKEVEDIHHYTWLTYYLHNNPVKAGLCLLPGDWKFSSYNAYITDKETMIAKEEVLSWFGGIEQFVLFHRSNIEADVNYKVFEELYIRL